MGVGAGKIEIVGREEKKSRRERGSIAVKKMGTGEGIEVGLGLYRQNVLRAQNSGGGALCYSVLIFFFVFYSFT